MADGLNRDDQIHGGSRDGKYVPADEEDSWDIVAYCLVRSLMVLKNAVWKDSDFPFLYN